jgi:hypothetical protein
VPGYELAQLNIALMVAPLESPILKDFVDNLDRINELAENSPGYIWRLQTDEGNATAMRPFGDEYLVNLSVWKSIEDLHHFVFKSAHAEIMRRRKAWFHKMAEAYTVLWWVPEGHRPSVAEAREKLQSLRSKGPTAEAFTFREPFPRPSPLDASAGSKA